MKVLYFARFKQVIGRGVDEITLPASVTTVEGLLNHLMATDEGCAAAFSNRTLVRCAVDQQHVQLSHALAQATEVAFFPPVTGG
jgi:sulfur-carrier protein